jgi:hypothetical protein
MRYLSLCLVLFTVACGPSNDSSSEVSRSKTKQKTTTVDSWNSNTDSSLSSTAPSAESDPSLSPDSSYADTETAVSNDSSDPSSDSFAPSPVPVSKDYPIGPDPKLTPGLRCTHPDEQRYPEKIDYCERSVSSSKKNSVIKSYDNQLGFRVDDLDRNKIKIDHYIPLCMGGDNDKSNLWPQHEVVYKITDPLEEQLCLALARGIITQNESIDDIILAKGHLGEAKAILAKIKALL